MNSYKINKNKSSLSTDEILRHKDFNKVLQEYKGMYNYKHATKPFYKNVKFLGFIILVCTVALVIVIVDKEENDEPKEVKKKQEVVAVKEIKKDTLATTKPVKDTKVKEEVSVNKQPKKSVIIWSDSSITPTEEQENAVVELDGEALVQVKMPMLIDGSLASAKETLKHYKLIAGTITYIKSPFKNLVIDQRLNGKTIKSGTNVPVGTIIDLVVGKPMKEVEIKNNNNLIYQKNIEELEKEQVERHKTPNPK